MPAPRKPSLGNVCRVVKPFLMGATQLVPGDVIDVNAPEWGLPLGRAHILIEQRYLEAVTDAVTRHADPPIEEDPSSVEPSGEVADEAVLAGATSQGD